MLAANTLTKWMGMIVLGLLWATQGWAQAPGREDVTVVSVTEVVESIDHETREVTLRDASGLLKQVVVGENVKRLSEVRVGDAVTVDFFVSVLYEVREPTEAELKEPFVELGHTVKATADQLPGEAALKQFRVVCTLVALDSESQTATLKGPKGNYQVVAIKNPENLKKLRIGMSVVVTHTEALAISLVKSDGKTPVEPAAAVMQTE